MTMTGSRSQNGSSMDEYYLATLGIHTHVSPNTLIGAMAQFDYQSTRNANASIEGHGWLVGPYIVTKLPDQPLVFEARALWGKSENAISPYGTYSDSFTTERFLLKSRLSGELAYNTLTLRPYASLTYTEDSQNAYKDSLGNQIDAQTVSLLQSELGLDFTAPLSTGDNAWVLDGGFFALHSSSSSLAANTPAFESTRGRVHLGLTRSFDGGQFSVGGFYDGIGARDYEAIGLEVSVNLKF